MKALDVFLNGEKKHEGQVPFMVCTFGINYNIK